MQILPVATSCLLSLRLGAFLVQVCVFLFQERADGRFFHSGAGLVDGIANAEYTLVSQKTDGCEAKPKKE